MDEVYAWHEQDLFDHVLSCCADHHLQIGCPSIDQKMIRMKRYLLFTTMLFMVVVALAQPCDSIRWSDHSLKWKYFKAKPDARSNMSALTESHIYYEIALLNKLAKFTISCSMITCKSWVKKERNKALLQHEQTHFDIAEYHKRLMVKEVLAQKFNTGDVFDKVKQIGNNILQQRKAMEDVYDLETYHSTIEKMQKAWTRKLHKLLKKTNDFEKEKFIIQLN